MSTANFAPTSRAPLSTAELYPALARALWQWLAVGGLLALLFPALRSQGPWIGPGILWLVAAPLSSLLVFHRHAIAAALSGVLVPTRRRRDSVRQPATFRTQDRIPCQNRPSPPANRMKSARHSAPRARTSTTGCATMPAKTRSCSPT